MGRAEESEGEGEGEKEDNEGEGHRGINMCSNRGDLRFLDAPSGPSAVGRVRTRNRRVHADLKMDSLSTVPPTPPPQRDASSLSGKKRTAK
ncbi:hypothetical protein PoB_003222200 [Plakobranchus ocellatus]|uniref:Uncharacterized protein n=1 Tax=Plakobranchus ocellatus TaxID=259542 RepID=A0AAV4AFB2_9GAST|nr:hypothetical protein PoB_003222200 [Plakobranchus ocellatus]